MTVQGYRTGFGVVISRSLFVKERAMKKAIVAFMVVAGLALMMTGCGEADTGAKKAPGAPGTTNMTPPPKAIPPAGEK
jgi:hypothetical protein